MTTFQITHNGKIIELGYSDSQFHSLESAKELTETGKKDLMVEYAIQGGGYNIYEKPSLLDGTVKSCDAAYARIIDLDIFVPLRLTISNK